MYANETKEAVGEVTFAAKPPANKIVGTYGNYAAQKVIFLVDKDRLNIYWNLSVLGILNYMAYAFLRRGIGRFL
jgi:hypothetical protein